MILATSKDIRVLLVKIADRLHNMRTIEAINNIKKKERIAKETMEIYAPLADRMGMHRIRDELEDLSFKVLNNKARELINNRLAEIKDDNDNSFNSISNQFTTLLTEHNLNTKIIGREKHFFQFGEKYKKKELLLNKFQIL